MLRMYIKLFSSVILNKWGFEKTLSVCMRDTLVSP